MYYMHTNIKKINSLNYIAFRNTILILIYLFIYGSLNLKKKNKCYHCNQTPPKSEYQIFKIIYFFNIYTH